MEDASNKFITEYPPEKKGRFQSEKLNRSRGTHQVDLQKQNLQQLKRDEVLAKPTNFTDGSTANDSKGDDDLAKYEICTNSEESSFHGKLSQELPKMMEMIQSPDLDSKLEATIKFRQVLSLEHNPSINDLVIQSGVVPTLVEFLKDAHPGTLQLEAAWALTNIASGTSDQTRVVVESGAVPHFVQLLYSQSLEIKEQAIWALGNVAGDSTNYRNFVLGSGAMEPVLALFNTTKISLIRTATWTLSNLCRGLRPQTDWNIVQQAIPTLAKLIYSADFETLVDALWTLSYLVNGPVKAIQAVLDARISHRLVELLSHESTLVQHPALRTIGNIVTGTDDQTQVMINAGVLHRLVPLCVSQKEILRKEVCWTISMITAGNSEQIQAVIDANLIPPIIRLLASGEYKTRREACWAISNATSGGLQNPDQIRYMVSQGCIKPLCDFLESSVSTARQMALKALLNILKIGELDKDQRNASTNEYAVLIEEAGGKEKIFERKLDTNLWAHDEIFPDIEKYFGVEDDVLTREKDVS